MPPVSSAVVKSRPTHKFESICDHWLAGKDLEFLEPPKVMATTSVEAPQSHFVHDDLGALVCRRLYDKVLGRCNGKCSSLCHDCQRLNGILEASEDTTIDRVNHARRPCGKDLRCGHSCGDGVWPITLARVAATAGATKNARTCRCRVRKLSLRHVLRAYKCALGMQTLCLCIAVRINMCTPSLRRMMCGNSGLCAPVSFRLFSSNLPYLRISGRPG
ncbi:hypothetical protein BS47DRAFT_455828 [Hydnum rufescens UP504]|uniref:Uncharacterized protein n=1 Tax=Hydnum rufescens UP504 TaxID=1448309 RepID=A0A9P6DPE1_9AGAM|nr:hypothetical protein BS47DRAFT_455828 [Hydnum rufescens UP504]